ncbi:MAG: SDR family oxidoreductase [Calditrichaeota bacterium]|nr:MAG: SDR family oxidoreductase [Calditrichota bacterium]
MANEKRPVAFVTGASMGIGYELARELAGHQYDLFLVARSRDLLEEHKTRFEKEFGVRVVTAAMDLSERVSWENVYQQAREEFGFVDIVVNNAGFGLCAPFGEADLATFLNMIDLNISALTALTHHFLHDMLAAGRGKILNVASVAGFFPGPYMAVYYATKAYVVNFSLALNYEVKSRGVLVSALCPGPTRTHFGERAGLQDSLLFTLMASTPSAVARAAYRGLMRNRTLIVPGLLNKLSVLTARIAPRSLAMGVISWMQLKKLNS